jgi:hypothetical protein
MANSKGQVSSDFQLFAADVTLRQLIAQAHDLTGGNVVVIATRDGRYVAFARAALAALADLLRRAPNRGLADELLDAPLGDVFAPLAYPGQEEGAARARWAHDPEGCFILITAGRVAGVLGQPISGSAADVLGRVGIDARRLDQQPTHAKPPLPGGQPPEPLPELRESAEASGPAERIPESPLDVPSGAGKAIELAEDALVKERIRLDVATPEAAAVGEPFDVAVAIRQLSSAQLQVDDLTKVTSAEGAIFRAASAAVVRYRVELEARNCEIDPASYEFLLEPGQDSIVQFFQVTPQRAGTISLRVNAYQADDDVLAASTRVQLTATIQVTEPSPSSPARVGAPPLALQLYGVLGGSQFSLDDLQHVAFVVDADWDNLAGDTKRAKARSLVQESERRGRLGDLRAAVLEARPDVRL